MSFELQPLTVEDAPRCVDIYFAAFNKNSHSLACWPRVPEIRAFWENMIRSEIPDPGAHWLKAVPTEGGDLVAFAKWNTPKHGVTPSTELPPWPAEADQKLCDETFGDWAQKHSDLMGSRGHWFLEILATHPSHQGKGIGSCILRWGIERADQDAVEAYLEASPEGVPIYQKFGFCQAARTNTWIQNERVKGEWYPEVFMIRPKKEEKAAV